MKNTKINAANFCKLFLFLLVSFSAQAMEQPKKLTAKECLENDYEEDKADPERPFKISMHKAFDFALQSLEPQILKEYNAVYNPSKIAIKKYNDFITRNYPKAYGESCRYGLICKKLESGCKFRHYILGAFHSTSLEALKGIYQGGYKISADNCSMGSGVYFTTSMNGNNAGAFIKSHKYGDYIIVNLVVVHRGIYNPKEVFSEKAQNWNGGEADIKYIPPGIKANSSSTTEYWGENVARYPEQVIPLGVLYKKDEEEDIE